MAKVTNQAQYHQLCRLKYNSTELQRAEKRAQASDDKENSAYTACKHKKLQSNEKNLQKDVCFFCGQPSGTSGLHRAATFQLDNRVWSCVVLLQDTELLAKLSTTDMMALEAKYHAKCLVSLYNRARKAKEEEHTDEMEAKAFAELVMYIEEQIDEEKAPVFKLNDLSQLYIS